MNGSAVASVKLRTLLRCRLLLRRAKMDGIGLEPLAVLGLNRASQPRKQLPVIWIGFDRNTTLATGAESHLTGTRSDV